MKFKDLSEKDKIRFINKWTKESYTPNKSEKEIREEVNQKRKTSEFIKGIFKIKQK